MKKVFTIVAIILLVIIVSITLSAVAGAACDTPVTPDTPDPGNLSTAVSVNANLNWNNSINATYYEVYFGTSPSSLALNGSSVTSDWTLPPLSAGTKYYWQVLAFNSSTCNTSGPIWNFTTECPDPSMPGGPDPLNLSTSVSVNPNLNWSDCSDTTYYEVYFGTNPSSLALKGSPNASNLSLSSLSSYTNYYWQVVARNGCGGTNSSPIWNFTTGCAAPGTPLAPDPANPSTQVSVNPNLNWSDCINASYYEVYCDTNPSPSTLRGNPTASNLSLSSLSSNTKYYWKVIAKNGLCSTNGSIWNFTTECVALVTPAYVSPYNASPAAPLNVSLDWDNCAGASYYEVYCDANPSPVTPKGSPNDSILALSNLSPNTKYYWKIVARDSCGSNKSGEIWNFTTVCAAPGTPVAPSPANLSTGIPAYADLDWGDCLYATSYEVYFGTNASILDLNGGTLASNWPLPNLSANIKYYWKVIAKNSCGNTSSDIWNFTTGVCAAPGRPQTPYPVNSSVNQSVSITLGWTASANASFYDVYLGTSASPTYRGNTSTNSYVVSNLSYNTKYYWQVVANNSCGSNSSDVWNFTTTCAAAPNKPQTPSPMNSSVNQSLSITLGWAASANVSLYDVYLGTSVSPTYRGNTSTNSYVVSNLSYNTKYYWQVAANNSCGNNSSDLWNFTTIAAPAPPPTISFNIGGTNASWNTSSAGIIPQAVNITSADAKIKMHIPAGTKALNSEDEPLDELNMSVTPAYPPALGDRRVIAAFNFKPDGATFEPGIQITLTYDPDTIPSGVNESSLIVAWYNESSKGWDYITGIVNTSANTITFTVRHFTTFSIQTPPVKHGSAGLSTWVIIVIIFAAAIVLGVIGGLYLKHRRIYGSLYYEDEGDTDDRYDKYREEREEEDFKF